jgi:hypothetical protein
MAAEHASRCPAVHDHGAKALALWKAAHKLLAASTADEARRVESGLLVSLRESCQQRVGVRRRASILRLSGAPGHRILKLHMGELPADFPEEKPTFTETEYLAARVGLCWHAIYDCELALQSTFAAWVQEYEDLHGPNSRLKQVIGDGRFESILIAPIWGRDGKRSPLGVVCLDSAEDKFYGVQDQQLVVMTAEALAIGWTKWPP